MSLSRRNPALTNQARYNPINPSSTVFALGPVWSFKIAWVFLQSNSDGLVLVGRSDRKK